MCLLRMFCSRGTHPLPTNLESINTYISGIDRKVDIKLHGKGNSNSNGARPVYQNHLDDKVDSD